MGGVQYIKVRCPSNGPKHGVRAWGKEYPSQYSISRSHLHKGSVTPLFFFFP